MDAPGDSKKDDGTPEDVASVPAQAAELPMSMTASMILTHLPKDTTQAIKDVDTIDEFKVPVRFSALPSAPALGKQREFKISASQRFEAVVNFLRKRLKLKEHEVLFCYVNSVFAPGLDEGVGNLFRCFKTDERLNVSYSITPAFG